MAFMLWMGNRGPFLCFSGEREAEEPGSVSRDWARQRALGSSGRLASDRWAVALPHFLQSLLTGLAPHLLGDLSRAVEIEGTFSLCTLLGL